MMHPTQSAPPVTTTLTALRATPVNPAEAAQARLFEQALRAEFAELNRIANTVAARVTQPDRPDCDSPRQPAQLSRIHARIGEVDRLLAALQNRFPHVRFANELPSASA